MKFAIMFSLFTFCSFTFALSPHPIYFSKDGRPSKQKIRVGDKSYVVGWDGAKLTLEYGPPNRNGSSQNGNKNYNDNDDQGYGLGCMLLISALFYGMVAYYLIRWWLN
jgi:hypothetical protein